MRSFAPVLPVVLDDGKEQPLPPPDSNITERLKGYRRMKRDEVLRILSEHRVELCRLYGVKTLALFGSVARGDADLQSDIDLLVDFDAPPGFDGYMGLKYHLEDLLGSQVDLVMMGALRPGARPVVEQEAVNVP